MYAVIKTGGKQYRVEQGDTLTIEKLDAEAGKTVTFDDVLLIGTEKETIADGKALAKASVKATVLEQMKDDKVLVFKYKAKKGYKRTQGHRQRLTKIKIDDISKGKDVGS
ncbi:MAG: 50S ribosomal protein L21 [Actinomycetota bacterium]